MVVRKGQVGAGGSFWWLTIHLLVARYQAVTRQACSIPKRRQKKKFLSLLLSLTSVQAGESLPGGALSDVDNVKEKYRRYDEIIHKLFNWPGIENIAVNDEKQKLVGQVPLLLGSMYLRSWLIQLNRSYIYIDNENIARTGISTLNGHISETVQNFEKLKKIRCNYFSILGLGKWFRNFPQCIFCHFWLI